MSDQMIVSMENMIDMVNQQLYIAIGKAIDEFSKTNQVTITTVEMTLAAFLGHEVGESCLTDEEVITNCGAYSQLMLSGAFGVREYLKKKAMN